MNFDEYQQLAYKTAGHGPDKQTDIFVSLLGLAGESGEVLDYMKKVYVHGHKLDEDKLKKELGDTIWYLSDLCSRFGFSLDEVAQLNIKKLKSRYPEGFSAQKSQNRKPEDV